MQARTTTAMGSQRFVSTPLHQVQGSLYFQKAVVAHLQRKAWIYSSSNVAMPNQRETNVFREGADYWKESEVNSKMIMYTPDWSSTSTKYENSSLVVPVLSLTLETKRLVFSFRADNKNKKTTTPAQK